MHAETEPEVVLFGLSSRILHESTISPEMLEMLELREDDDSGHEDKNALGSSSILKQATVTSK